MNNRKKIGPKMSNIIVKQSFPMVKENNCEDGDVKLFPKIIGIVSLLKNEPSTSHRSEN